MKLSALLAMLTGCSPKPVPPPAPPPIPQPTVADLKFPVAVLYSGASVFSYRDADDLGNMYISLVINSDSAPTLIDSDFNIYTLEHLRSTHGGLWLMAHPAGGTEVAFDLKRAPKSGLEAARDAMSAQLDKQTWRDDIAKKHKALDAQKDLKGMMKIMRDPAN